MVRHVLAIDEAILLRVRKWHAPAMTVLMRSLTRMGDAASWVLVGLVLLCLGGVARDCGWRIGLAAGTASLLSQVLKRLCRRPRPSSGIGGFTALVENPDAFSFPSGHACAAFAVAVALAGHGMLGPAHLLLAVAIGTSRVYLGAHYPLDVGAGAALGVLAGAVTRVFLSEAAWF